MYKFQFLYRAIVLLFFTGVCVCVFRLPRVPPISNSELTRWKLGVAVKKELSQEIKIPSKGWKKQRMKNA